MADASLPIARVAQGAGGAVETIRYYERKGIIEQPQRRNGENRPA